MMNSNAAALREVVEDFVRAYNTGDVDRLMSAYADDFVDMPEGEPTLAGARAYEDTSARLRDTFAKFTGNLNVQVEESVVFDDWAFDWGTLRVELQPKSGGEPVVVERRFLEIWRRQAGGEWKVARAMDNSAAGGARSLDFRQ